MRFASRLSRKTAAGPAHRSRAPGTAPLPPATARPPDSARRLARQHQPFGASVVDAGYLDLGQIAAVLAQPSGAQFELAKTPAGHPPASLRKSRRSVTRPGVDQPARSASASRSSSRRVRTRQPCSVTSTVCSYWADRRRSRVVTVQPSLCSFTAWPPWLDHRFDGEGHPGLQPRTRASATEVQDLRRLVHLAADAMPAVFADHRITVGFGVTLDGMPDIAEGGVRAHHADRPVQAFAGDVEQLLRLAVDGADPVHLAAVAEIAVLITVTSTLTISPSRRICCADGQPWQTTSLTEVFTVNG